MSIVSPIQYDDIPRPLLVRKATVFLEPKYHVEYDYKNDCITIVTSETVHQRPAQRPASLPRWHTIREVYTPNSKHDYYGTDNGESDALYEEVTQITDLTESQQNITSAQNSSLKSRNSLDVSSLITLLSSSLLEYLTLTNIIKVLIIVSCVNGLLLQMVLLTVQYFSNESTFSLKFGDSSELSSITICVPIAVKRLQTNTSIREEFWSNRNRNYSIFVKIFCQIKEVDRKSARNCDKPVQSIDQQSVCQTYSIRFDVNYFVELSANLSADELRDGESARLSIHSPTIIPNIRDNEFVSLAPHQHVSVSFWRIAVKRLSSPYSSCVAYEPTFSRFDCLHRCVSDSIGFACHCVPRQSSILVTTLVSHLNDTYNWCASPACESHYNSLKEFCENSCSQECTQESYYTKMTIKRDSNTTYSVSVTPAKNDYKTSQDLIMTQNVGLSFDQYFATLGGLVVIWTVVLVIAFWLIYLFRQFTTIYSIQDEI